MPNGKHHRVLIVGGGTAGITVAAILRRRARGLDIAIVEPEQEHYYQPALTLVGAGVYPLAKTHRPEASVIPPGVQWIRGAAKTFEPEKNTVRLQDGDAYIYDYLVVCTGVKLDWGKVAGLGEALGRNGVCSNYSPSTVSYTWECVQTLKPGDKVVCTQPPLPFKCPGAPQKIIYLIADRLRRREILKDCKLDFFTHAPAIFGVPYFARALVKICARYGINVHYQQNLVAVDGVAKIATFEFVGDNGKGERENVPFDLLHVSPPQSAHDEIKSSPLANAAGWVEVNQATMQHVRFANVYSLGDVCSTPNSKTAADRQDHSRRIHLRWQSYADLTAQSGQGALDRLVDQADRSADHVLALHAEGTRLVPKAQYEFQGRRYLTILKEALPCAEIPISPPPSSVLQLAGLA
jgi:sulfide:quinone oxidoreductase